MPCATPFNKEFSDCAGTAFVRLRTCPSRWRGGQFCAGYQCRGNGRIPVCGRWLRWPGKQTVSGNYWVAVYVCQNSQQILLILNRNNFGVNPSQMPFNAISGVNVFSGQMFVFVDELLASRHYAVEQKMHMIVHKDMSSHIHPCKMTANGNPVYAMDEIKIILEHPVKRRSVRAYMKKPFV